MPQDAEDRIKDRNSKSRIKHLSEQSAVQLKRKNFEFTAAFRGITERQNVDSFECEKSVDESTSDVSPPPNSSCRPTTNQIQCTRENSAQRKNVSSETAAFRGGRAHTCQICDKKLTTQHGLSLHMMIHNGEKPLRCTNCDERFRQRVYLKRHVMAKHTGAKPHACVRCQKKFVTSAELRMHERIHNGERPFKCNSCEKKFVQTAHLNTHIVRCHTEVKSRSCTTQVASRTEMNKHALTCSGRKPSGRFKSITQNGNRLKNDEARHGKFDETKENNSKHYLPVDAKAHRMHSLSILEDRGQVKNAVPGSAGCTNNCIDSHTETSTELLQYKTVEYTAAFSESGEKPLRCPNCDERFRLHLQLLKHQLTEHSGERLNVGLRSVTCEKPAEEREKSCKTGLFCGREKSWYTCQFCDKKLYSSRGFKLHTMMHSGEKPLRCPQCDERFRQRNHLTRHQIMKHDGVRPYACHHCEKKFATSTELKRHEMFHSRVNRFKYHGCENKSVQKSQLSTHILSSDSELKQCGSLNCTKQFVDCSEMNKNNMSMRTGRTSFHQGSTTTTGNDSRRRHGKLHCRKRTITETKSINNECRTVVTNAPQLLLSDIAMHINAELASKDSNDKCEVQIPHVKQSSRNEKLVAERVELSTTFQDSVLNNHQRKTRGEMFANEKRFNHRDSTSNTSLELNSDSRLSITPTVDSIIAGNSEFVSSPQPNNYCEMRSNPLSETTQLQQHAPTNTYFEHYYECDECPTMFSDYRQLVWHRLAHA